MIISNWKHSELSLPSVAALGFLNGLGLVAAYCSQDFAECGLGGTIVLLMLMSPFFLGVSLVGAGAWFGIGRAYRPFRNAAVQYATALVIAGTGIGMFVMQWILHPIGSNWQACYP